MLAVRASEFRSHGGGRVNFAIYSKRLTVGISSSRKSITDITMITAITLEAIMRQKLMACASISSTSCSTRVTREMHAASQTESLLSDSVRGKESEPRLSLSLSRTSAERATSSPQMLISRSLYLERPVEE